MLEVCVDSISSAISAIEGGAGRLELCSALSEGGLTPSVGTLKILKKHIQQEVPIFVMIRPRAGDFHYTTLELDAMVEDIQMFIEAGADGFVFGALDESDRIDPIANKFLLNASGDFPVTFHRCFDLTSKKDYMQNCDLLSMLGFKRILTSGYCNTVEDGIENIKKLIDYESNLTIVPGGGINTQNLSKILIETKCKEFHASARVAKSLETESKISFGGAKQPDAPFKICSKSIVEELVNISKTCSKN